MKVIGEKICITKCDIPTFLLIIKSQVVPSSPLWAGAQAFLLLQGTTTPVWARA